MIVYLFILVVFLIFGKLADKNRGLFLFISMGSLWFISVFRSYTVGNDTITYIQLFPQLAFLPKASYLGTFNDLFTSRFETGYILLNKLVYSFTTNPRYLLIITATIFILSVIVFFQNLSFGLLLSTVLLVTMGPFALSLSGLRQTIALSLIILAFTAMMNKKDSLSIVLVISAGFFHRTAFLFLILFLLKKIKFNKKTIIALLISTFVFYFLFSGLLNKLLSVFTSYSTYSNAIESAEPKLATMLKIFLLIVIIVFCNVCKNLATKNNFNKVFKNNSWNIMMSLLLISVCINIISLRFSQIGRACTYFDAMYLILIPNSITLIGNKRARSYLSAGVILFSIFYFIIIQSLRPEWAGIIPYTIFNQ